MVLVSVCPRVVVGSFLSVLCLASCRGLNEAVVLLLFSSSVFAFYLSGLSSSVVIVIFWFYSLLVLLLFYLLFVMCGRGRKYAHATS